MSTATRESIIGKYVENENNCLAAYAQKSSSTQAIKRQFEEPGDDDRLPYQRDRDKILHCMSFRRLAHKTQVITTTSGDHFRTRLTHTLEVSQIARSIAKRLGLNEELTEAIALGHDIGHTPFGHVGERTLHRILTREIQIIMNYDLPDAGGFKHNFQGVYLSDKLENWCKEDIGLNLCLAVRDGIIKHTDFVHRGEKNQVVYPPLIDIDLSNDIPFTLEGQVVKIADDIAQATHDLEDGFHCNIIKSENIINADLVKMVMKNMDLHLKESDIPGVDMLRRQLVGPMVGFLIEDVVVTTENNLSVDFNKGPYPEKYVRKFVNFSSVQGNDVKLALKALKKLIKNLYITSLVASTMDERAEHILTQLFKKYWSTPSLLPDNTLERYFKEKDLKDKLRSNLHEPELQETIKNDPRFVRLIADHIAGMTDQYAFKQYKQLFMPE